MSKFSLKGVDLVFMEADTTKAVPYTTSEIIAERAGIKKKSIDGTIRKYKKELEEFGVLNYETKIILTGGDALMENEVMTQNDTCGGLKRQQVELEEKAGKSNNGTKYAIIYNLNEEQATFLLTMLRNTPTVINFKKELVKQFYAMRKELAMRIAEIERRREARRTLTDRIRDSIPETPHKKFMYKHYTDLAYKNALGKTAAQIRKERGASKDANASTFLTSQELKEVSRLERWIGTLVELGVTYQAISTLVTERNQAWIATHANDDNTE